MRVERCEMNSLASVTQSHSNSQEQEEDRSCSCKRARISRYNDEGNEGKENEVATLGPVDPAVIAA